MATTQPEEKKQHYHWIAKLLITAVSAIIAAIGGGLAGTIMLLFFGWQDSATVAVIQGPPVGFLVGGIAAFWIMQKEKTLEKVIFIPIPLAVIISCVAVLILNLNYLL